MMLTRRTILAGATALGAGCILPLAAKALPGIGGHAFGSYWRLVSGSEVDETNVRALIGLRIETTNASMSPYLRHSELTILNSNDSTDWVRLSGDMAEVARHALQTAEESGGAFDPTVGPIVGQYGFGPIRRAKVGDAGDLEFRNGALRRSKPGVTVDLCGIAKGWALDRTVAALEASGIRNFILELGGEVAVRGRHRSGRKWRVAIDGTDRVLELDGRSVATSGSTLQSYNFGARRYGHIIDPRTGAAATGDLLSVSVIAKTAIAADAWATALFSRGVDGAIELGEACGVDAVLVVKDGDKQRVMTTGVAGRWLQE
ncbi:MAG: FAD:protein FMN transferase [Rhodobacter sp.]|nr:FAD:protein FMN transferase [Rhodobacter sp.]